MFAPMLYMFEVYGRVLNSRSMQTMGALLALLIACLFAMEVLEWVRFRVLRSLGLLIDQRYRHLVFQSLFHDSTQIDRRGATNPVTDLRLLKDVLTNPGFISLFDLPSGIAFLVFLYVLNSWLLWGAVAALILQVVLGFANALWGKSDKRLAQQYKSKAETQITQAIANRVSTLAMQMDRTIVRRWAQLKRQSGLSSDRSQELALTVQSLTKLLQLLTGSTLLGLAAWFVIQNELTGGAGMMIVASTLGARLLMPASSIIGNWSALNEALQAMKRVNQLIHSQRETGQSLTLPVPKGNVRFEKVYSHPLLNGKEAVLKNIDFELAPGSILAVVGPTGSGKSSFLKTMLGLWPCQRGAVRLDGADIFQWDKTQLGQHLGYLPQDVDLFEGSVASNLTRFGVEDSKSLASLSESLSLDFVESDLGGMQSVLLDEGANLSAGQRQKLGLARAFYGRPALIALDEPSSRLDERSEKLLMALMKARSHEGATIVFTTHRMALLNVADKVLLLSKGSSQWMGSKDEFVARLDK